MKQYFMGLSALLFLLFCVACSEDAVHLPTGSLQSGIKIRTAAFGTQGTTTELPAEKQISNLQAYLFSGKALVRSFTDLSVGSDSICRIDADNETGKLYFLANIDADPDLEVVINTIYSGVVAYDLPGTSQAVVLWGTGRGNQQRSGFVP